MSDYSQSVRQRFLSQFTLAWEDLTLLGLSEESPALRFRLRGTDPALLLLPILCPLTAACQHVSTNAMFYVYDYPHAAEELAIPRGMGHAIAKAADAEQVSPWRQRCLAWWREQLLQVVGEPTHAR